MGILVGMVYARMADEEFRVGSCFIGLWLRHSIFLSNSFRMAIKTKKQPKQAGLGDGCYSNYFNFVPCFCNDISR